ncbi:MAG: phytanoyl-CoA dioxygenase family protein [Bacteroidetes bacterium]|nr:phytanoyl-CoA dioxygenase family protein [Bacteroidota bacterium]
MKDVTRPSAKDLAKFHGPLTDLFPKPSNSDEWKEYALSESQIKFYKENGFLTGIKILTESQVVAFQEELTNLLDPTPEQKKLFYHYKSNESEDPHKILFHALGAWRVSPLFHDVLWSPAFRMAAYQLLGLSYRQFHDQLFCKPARHGGAVAWHQDFSYWTWTKPNTHLSCWISLDDVTTENGCVYFIPGSHKWGLLPITGLTGDMEAVNEVLDEKKKDAMRLKFPNELKRGYASFHSSVTMHGSYANFSEQQRRAMVINVMGADTLSNINSVDREEDLKDFPTFPQDSPMTGTYYPILFDEDQELGRLKTDILTIKDF